MRVEGLVLGGDGVAGVGGTEIGSGEAVEGWVGWIESHGCGFIEAYVVVMVRSKCCLSWCEQISLRSDGKDGDKECANGLKSETKNYEQEKTSGLCLS